MQNLLIYGGFIGFVIAMLVVDLKLFHADAKEASNKQAAAWVVVWVSLALAFGVGLYFFEGGQSAAEYFAGYLIEYSLSVDNLFVFIVIFSYFKVPPSYRHRVLFFGILGAIVFRGLFIAIGTALLERFDWIIYVFGALLVITAIRVARGTEEMEPDKNPVLRLFSRRFRTSTQFDGQKLFTKIDGKTVATPLFVVLLVVETTDIVFAVDSIPAIFAITRDPFIVLTSNVFAILGLRALYFLLSGTMAKFHLLKYGLAIILGFVGLKMIATKWIHLPIWVSLSVIVGVLGATALASVLWKPALDAHEPEQLDQGDERLPR